MIECCASPWRPIRPFGSCFALANALEFITGTLGWVKVSHTQVSAERRLNTLRSFSAPTQSEMLDLVAVWNFMSVKSNGSKEDVLPFGSNTPILGSDRRMCQCEVPNTRVI